MKFMPQGVFDVAAMLILRDTFADGEAGFNSSLQTVVDGYQSVYSGDQDFVPQLVETVRLLARHYAAELPANFGVVLTRAIKLRMELDDNMKRKSTVNKILGGSMFSPGHPAPQVRVAQAEAHIKYLVKFIGDLPLVSK